MNISDLSDQQILSALTATITSERHLVTRVIVFLAEVEKRRLDLKAACPSLFEFCTRRLGLSDGEAFRRITAARLTRRFPAILPMLERGEIHMSALVLLRDHLTDENHEALLRQAVKKSKREVLELIARRSPKPDVPSTIRQLPMPETAPHAAACATSAKPVLEPLSETRYKLQLTASAAMRDKLERATELMRHSNPAGDFAVVLERALDLLIVHLEKQRLGKTSRPNKSRPTKPGSVSRATRREVFSRDGERCTYVDDDGNRCPARSFLELDHVDPRACGGSDEPANLRVLCKRHNRLLAEQRFGRAKVEHHIRQRKSPAPQSAVASPFDLVLKGLTNLGFREPEARRALTSVCQRTSDASPVDEILRQALAVLT